MSQPMTSPGPAIGAVSVPLPAEPQDLVSVSLDGNGWPLVSITSGDTCKSVSFQDPNDLEEALLSALAYAQSYAHTRGISQITLFTTSGLITR